MSALYRQARPITFDEMVGQEHVKEVLNNALKSGRLAQAYLFSGPRGVGKTSSARLIAQAVNCSADSKPCGVCEGCRLVREGRHPDVMEIDAASNNSVEDVRDLRERILLSPIMSPQEKKVVILDEAHMMSKSAFNALLKTLEEPPPHVIFIFATTEPERMPATILSRTQHFRFRRLSESEIAQKLNRILLGIGREAEPKALQLVARMADGAMRDAESLLDRLLTLEGTITLVQTEAALGLPPQEALYGVAEAIDGGNIKVALEAAAQLYTQGFAARTLAQGLLEAIRAGLYGRMGLGTGPHLSQPDDRLVAAMTALDETLERLLRRSDALSLELAVLAAYQALHQAPVGESNVERQAPNAVQTPSLPSKSAVPAIPDFDPKPRRPEAREPSLESPPLSPAPQRSDTPPPTTIPTNVQDLASEWRGVMGALKMNVRAFVREAEPRFDDGKVTLIFSEKNSFHFENSKKNLDDIRKAVQEVLGINDVELLLGKKKLTDDPPSPRFTPSPSSVSSLAAQVVETSKPAESPRLEVPKAPVSFDNLGQPPKTVAQTPQTPPEQPSTTPPLQLSPEIDQPGPEQALTPISTQPAPQAELTIPESPPPNLFPTSPLQPTNLEPALVAEPAQNPASEMVQDLAPELDLEQAPELVPWTPEDAPFGDSEQFTDEDSPPIAKAVSQTNLLDDPKYKSVVKMFGGRLKKLIKDTPKEAVVDIEPDALPNNLPLDDSEES